MVKLPLVDLRYGNNTDGETDVFVAVAETRAGDTSDAGFFEEREGIFTWEELAPIVNRGIVVNVYFFEQRLLFVDVAQLLDETLATQAIKGA